MKIGLHYSFQVGKGERSESIIGQGLKDLAWADKNGFSSVVFAEHHFLDDGWLPRPMMLAAAAAAVTENMRVGTDIVILALHHPVAVAEEAAVLDVLSGGRAVLGVGLGWIEAEFDGFGVPYKKRAAIYQRSIEIVRKLLAGETVDNDGHYGFKGARIRPLPVNPRGIPLWMGALADAGVERVARSGDAWVMPPGTRVPDLVRQRALFTETRAAAGLPPVAEQPVRREIFVAETDEKAWQLFAPGVRHEYGLVYRPLHPTYPENDTLDALKRFGEGMFIVGAPETVAAEMRRLEDELGATECLIRFQLPNISEGAIGDCLHGVRDVIGLLGRA